MDYKELHEPYRSEASPSVEGQIVWLQKKGIPGQIIDQAMLHVYDELGRGKTFEDKQDDGGRLYAAGAQLDHYLLETARRLWHEDVGTQLAHLQNFHQALIDKHHEKWKDEFLKIKKPGFWARLKFLFTGQL